MSSPEDRIHILYVDDEDANLKAFRSTFRREMTVLTASSGAEALELLATGTVHVVVSDQRMPGMSGAEFLAIVRERHPQAMRILLTGYADLEAVVDAVNKGGIHAYATKPWDENDLRLRIQQVYEVQRLRREKEALLSRYSQVFEASGDPIAIVDQKGAIHDANPAAERLLGTPRSELLGSSFTSFLENPSQLIGSLRAGRRGQDFINVDLSMRKPGGDVIDCLMTASRMGRDAEGRVLFQAILKNITDRKLEEKRLRKLNSELDRRVEVRTSQLLEALEDLGSFSYTVAHDLRSPLKNLIALSEMLQEHVREQADVEALAYTQRIRKGAQRMIDLVDDLLRFSQTSNRALERREFDLHALIEEVVREQVAADRLGQVHNDVPQGMLMHADPPMITVVLHNLLSNALKFTRGRAVPEIRIGHLLQNGEHVLMVRDNGVGFDAKHRDQAFGVFKRLHGKDQFEGTGVGLAIVDRIASKHGGRAWAESEPDKGTTLFVAIPDAMPVQEQAPFMKVA